MLEELQLVQRVATSGLKMLKIACWISTPQWHPGGRKLSRLGPEKRNGQCYDKVTTVLRQCYDSVQWMEHLGSPNLPNSPQLAFAKLHR